VSFIARYLSLTSSRTINTRFPTQTNKTSYLCNISQKMPYFNYIVRLLKNGKVAFLGGKNPLNWHSFFGLLPHNLTVRELVYDKLFNVYTLLEDLPYREIFSPYGEKKSSPYRYRYMLMTSTRL
jgi:hypothetical protein